MVLLDSSLVSHPAPSDYGVAGAGSNTTVVVTVTAHHEVTIHAPGLAPAAWGGGEGEKGGGKERKTQRERAITVMCIN